MSRWAHPRSRGENDAASAKRFADLGSSPLTRGKLGCQLAETTAPGLIPAHAGKTRLYPRRSHRGRAHPRSRGENTNCHPFSTSGWGSSPLTRGKRRVPRRRILREGLIPAHAGKTMPPTRASLELRAHPRSRGENSVPTVALMAGPGSSPLTRGKRRRPRHGARPRGLIPAHAGKTYQP